MQCVKRRPCMVKVSPPDTDVGLPSAVDPPSFPGVVRVFSSVELRLLVALVYINMRFMGVQMVNLWVLDHWAISLPKSEKRAIRLSHVRGMCSRLVPGRNNGRMERRGTVRVSSSPYDSVPGPGKNVCHMCFPCSLIGNVHTCDLIIPEFAKTLICRGKDVRSILYPPDTVTFRV